MVLEVNICNTIYPWVAVRPAPGLITPATAGENRATLTTICVFFMVTPVPAATARADHITRPGKGKIKCELKCYNTIFSYLAFPAHLRQAQRGFHPALWCNGSTADFGSAGSGSSPDEATSLQAVELPTLNAAQLR